jgi:hypothetical protein
VFAADGVGGNYIVGVAGQDHPDGNLAVVGGVGSVESARAAIKADFTAYLAAQRTLQRRRIHDGGLGGASTLYQICPH